MEKDKKKILIADSQFLITESLQNLLTHELDYEIKEVVTTKGSLIQALTGDMNLLIIDFNHLDFDNLSEFKHIVFEISKIPVLILVNALSNNELTELNSFGVKNILLKTVEKNELISAIEAAMSGRKYYSTEVLDMLTEMYESKNSIKATGMLTKAEIEIIKLIAEGYTTKEIANLKFNSYHTVMTHRKNIFRKLKINNASELVMFAIRTGMIDNIEYFI